MADGIDKDLDALLESASQTLARSEELFAQAEEQERKQEEWKAEFGLDGGTGEKVLASMTPAEREQAEKERERNADEIRRDIGEALDVAAGAGGGAARRMRNFA